MKLLRSLLVSTFCRNRRLHVSAWKNQDKKRNVGEVAWIQPTGFDTGIVVYNPIVKSKVPLITRNEGYASWYMCGPTVYDSAHIGHACSYVKLDIIRRILVEYFDINLITMMGITDIDDKIIKKSGESKRDWKELTRFYEKEFFSDMAELNVQQPYLCCRVSEHMPQILQFIFQILKNGGAYVTDEGSVYFDTSKYQAYGKLGIKETTAPCTQGKRNGQDFALWKAAKPGEPFWESSWGPGRPGWHIECSVMASEKFGKSVDIHSGGIDLAFPHHENEEAQSCQHHGVSQWVNYWLHTGHLHINSMKMSKSLGNSVSIAELLDKFTADQFRLFCLTSHYRRGVEYTDDLMAASVAILKKVECFLDDCNNYVNGTLPEGNVDEVVILQSLAKTKSVIQSALAGDFDTPKAIREITSLVTLGNKMLHSPEEEGTVRSPAVIAALANYITSTLKSFGLETNTKNTQKSSIQTADVIDDLVNLRRDVRNFALEVKLKDKRLLEACDAARKNLSLHGVQIKDYGNTSTWSFGGARKT
ncbi:cysteine--tRNA ligase, mitochondrial isoform X1 [Neodiprion pinetum]|uniref:cysteine--tRNA ligase, mitochondrial isoform X1 n=2 Tax=Neodiprion pinetum TaxID=441929 RepID=UPI001EE0E2DB|nr:cysteine--tRNA ligase, mitochondrial isoform X1 [Neodiprion pinetum]